MKNKLGQCEICYFFSYFKHLQSQTYIASITIKVYIFSPPSDMLRKSLHGLVAAAFNAGYESIRFCQIKFRKAEPLTPLWHCSVVASSPFHPALESCYLPASPPYIQL